MAAETDLWWRTYYKHMKEVSVYHNVRPELNNKHESSREIWMEEEGYREAMS